MIYLLFLSHGNKTSLVFSGGWLSFPHKYFILHPLLTFIVSRGLIRKPGVLRFPMEGITANKIYNDFNLQIRRMTLCKIKEHFTRPYNITIVISQKFVRSIDFLNIVCREVYKMIMKYRFVKYMKMKICSKVCQSTCTWTYV